MTDATIPESELLELLSLSEKATPRPWRWHGFYLLQDCPKQHLSADNLPGAKEDNPYSTPCGYPIADDGSAGGEYSATLSKWSAK